MSALSFLLRFSRSTSSTSSSARTDFLSKSFSLSISLLSVKVGGFSALFLFSLTSFVEAAPWSKTADSVLVCGKLFLSSFWFNMSTFSESFSSGSNLFNFASFGEVSVFTFDGLCTGGRVNLVKDGRDNASEEFESLIRIGGFVTPEALAKGKIGGFLM